MENFGKTAVFPGGYGRIGEIPHGRIWPDWGLWLMMENLSCLPQFWNVVENSATYSLPIGANIRYTQPPRNMFLLSYISDLIVHLFL